jgi:hypothetical protein
MQYPFWIRRPKTTLLLWFVFYVSCFVPIAGPAIHPSLAPIFPGLIFVQSIKGGIQSDDPDLPFDAESKKIFGDDEYVLVAVDSQGKGALSPEVLEKVDHLTRSIKAIDGVRDIWSLTDMDHIRGREGGELDTRNLITEFPKTPEEVKAIEAEIASSNLIPNWVISNDKNSAVVVIEILENDPVKRVALIDKIAAVVDAEKAKAPGTIHFAGFAVTDYYTSAVSLQDQAFNMLGVLLMCTLLMWLVTRSWQAVAATNVVVFVSQLGIIGGIAAFRVPMGAVVAFAGIIAVAISLGYIIYLYYAYVEHVYAEAKAGRTITDYAKAVYESTQDEKRAYTFAVLSTMIGFGAMITNTVPDLVYMGVFTAVGAMIAGICCYTVMPAILVLKPLKKLDPSKPINPTIQKIADAIAASTLKRPYVHFGSIVAIVILGGLGLSTATLDSDTIKLWWRKTDPVRIEEHFIRDHTGGTTILRTVISTKQLDYFKEPANLKKLEEVQAFVLKQPHVTKSVSQVDNIKLINRALHGNDQAHYVIPNNKAEVEQYLLLHKEPDDFRPLIDSDYSNAAIIAKMDTMNSRIMRDFEIAVEQFIATKFTDIQEARTVGTSLLLHRAYDVIAENTTNGLTLSVLLMSFFLWISLRAAGIVTVGKAVKIGTLLFIPNLAPLLVAIGLVALIKPLNPALTVVCVAALGVVMDDTTHLFFTWFDNHTKKGMTPLEAGAAALRRNGRAVILTSTCIIMGLVPPLFARLLDTAWTALMIIITLAVGLLFDLFFTPVLLSFMNFEKAVPAQKKAEASGERPAATI